MAGSIDLWQGLLSLVELEIIIGNFLLNLILHSPTSEAFVYSCNYNRDVLLKSISGHIFKKQVEEILTENFYCDF